MALSMVWNSLKYCCTLYVGLGSVSRDHNVSNARTDSRGTGTGRVRCQAGSRLHESERMPYFQIDDAPMLSPRICSATSAMRRRGLVVSFRGMPESFVSRARLGRRVAARTHPPLDVQELGDVADVVHDVESEVHRGSQSLEKRIRTPQGPTARRLRRGRTTPVGPCWDLTSVRLSGSAPESRSTAFSCVFPPRRIMGGPLRALRVDMRLRNCGQMRSLPGRAVSTRKERDERASTVPGRTHCRGWAVRRAV